MSKNKPVRIQPLAEVLGREKNEDTVNERTPKRRPATRTAMIALSVVAAFMINGLSAPGAMARPFCDQPESPPICGEGDPRRPRPSAPPEPVVAKFTWSVPDRFMLGPAPRFVPVDVIPKTWSVNLDACGSSGGIAGTRRYHWSIDGVALPPTSCATRVQVPRLGTYSIHLTVVGKGTGTGGALVEDSTVQTVPVRDLLVVSLGDSIASGEGNPDVHEKTFHDADWETEICHRSRVAGPAQAALALERRDPHSSVTFISLACSGAAILAGTSGDGGLLRPYGGVDGGKGPALPAQVEEARKLTWGRSIDVLLMSAGANDVGFAKIVTGCLDGTMGGFKRNPNYDCSKPTSHVQTRAEEAITLRLPGLYDQLAREVTARLKPYRVLITQYPDVTRDENGNVCNPLMVMGTPPGRISRAEAQWAYDEVITGMNDAISAAAARNPAAGWEVVSLGDAFSRGGYCSDRGRLIRILSESLEFQADESGSLHPNEGGHTAIAQRILAKFDAPPPRDRVLPLPAKPITPAAPAAPSRLVVSQPLTVTVGTANQPTTASLTVKNTGGQPLTVPYVMVGARGANGANVDFPASPAFTLQPGATYTYQQPKQLPPGTYTAWPATYNGTVWTELSARQDITVPTIP